MSKPVEVAVPGPVLLMRREMSPQFIADSARKMEATGVVDYFQSSDQMSSWFPRSLWKPENSPVARTTPDHDSRPDGFMLAAWAVAATERLGIAMTTDAIRRGPAELVQTMLTLANARQGKVVMMLGAGELKQIKPFGYRRVEGLDRMEDLLQIWNQFLDSTDAVSFEGHHWHLEHADLGATGRAHRPKVWGMGGGPRLLELSVKHADGIVSATPGAFPYPEDFEKFVTATKRSLEQLGRDPETFDFGLFVGATIDEDRAQIEAGWRNPIIRWGAAVLGRLTPADWARDGINGPVDWHYALKMLPTQISERDALAITDAVSDEQMKKSFIYGSPTEVASQLNDFVDAGCNFFSLWDLLGFVRQSDEGLAPMETSVQTARLLKESLAQPPALQSAAVDKG